MTWHLLEHQTDMQSSDLIVCSAQSGKDILKGPLLVFQESHWQLRNQPCELDGRQGCCASLSYLPRGRSNPVHGRLWDKVDPAIWACASPEPGKKGMPEKDLLHDAPAEQCLGILGLSLQQAQSLAAPGHVA